MVYKLSDTHSILNTYLSEIRDKSIQTDRLRFRTNIERIASILAYEASKSFDFKPITVYTPLGQKNTVIPSEQIIVASILRAGLPMHYAVLNVLDMADNCFVSAYRRHHKSGEFEIRLEYIASPSLEGKTLLVCDPMIASGASIIATLEQLERYGKPKRIVLLGILASAQGIATILNKFSNIDMYVADIDEELTAKSYIVPGLGDAGDLCFGEKLEI